MFERFWQLYPRKVGKLAARREWERAVRTAQVEGQTAEDILRGVERYRGEVADKDVQFICHPRTWLHQGRWMDEADEGEKVDTSRFRKPTPQEAELYLQEHPYLGRLPEWVPNDWRPKLRAVK